MFRHAPALIICTLLSSGCGNSKTPSAPDVSTDTPVAVDTLTDTIMGHDIEAVDVRPDTAYADSGLPDTPLPPEDECPPGVVCIETLPATLSGDTSIALSAVFDAYSCKPSVDESGPEVIYQVTVPGDGFLSAAVYDSTGVDIDVHILDDLDPETCLSRGHHQASSDVKAGTYYIVADTFVSDGELLSGAYELDIGFFAPSKGSCEMEIGFMERVGDGGEPLLMPATGPMVMEAHLVTQDEPAPFPMTATEELLEHYLLSQDTTGFVMYRSQVWAPLEGGNFYGAGIGPASLLPVLEEGWYVNMYWTHSSRPDRGTRMILRDPDSGRAVVVAAGHETGPGNLDNIGGTPEETHHYLGTGHKSVLTLGIALDQDLSFGPRTCE